MLASASAWASVNPLGVNWWLCLGELGAGGPVIRGSSFCPCCWMAPSWHVYAERDQEEVSSRAKIISWGFWKSTSLSLLNPCPTHSIIAKSHPQNSSFPRICLLPLSLDGSFWGYSLLRCPFLRVPTLAPLFSSLLQDKKWGSWLQVCVIGACPARV